MEKKTVVECEVDSNLEANSDLALDMKSDSTSETGSEECPEVDNAVNANVPSRTVHASISQDENLKEATPVWEDYKLIFDKFDRDGDGYLSSDDVRNVLRSYDMLSTEGELQDVVAELDKKGDGLITLEEFVSVMNSHKSIFSKKDEKDLEFREVFRILDKSGTGRVTKQALCEFMSEFEPSFDEEHAFELMTQFDTKGNGDLSYEDFVKLLTAKV
eukprot:XP_019925475.1 PREDICTED: calmodulin-beta-like [Crassostrea gigas]